MKWSLAILVLVGVLLDNAAFAGWCDDHPRRSTRRDDGTSIGLFISEEQIAKAPKWSPEQGDPPLSPSKTWKLAIAWGATQLSPFDSIKIDSINLTRYSCSSFKNLWYYIVEYTPMIDRNRLYGAGNWLAVLMDGTLIATRKYKDTFKYIPRRER